MAPLWAGRDRRQHRRYTCGDEVRVRPVPDGRWAPARLIDISVSGCAARLETEFLLQPGATVELRFGSQYFAFSTLGEVCSVGDQATLLRLHYRQLSARAISDILSYARDQEEQEILRLVEEARIGSRVLRMREECQAMTEIVAR